MSDLTLGLDLGPNSIGWALISESEILAAGVRVFPEGVENYDTKKEKPKNETRRLKRGVRRQIARRARRKRQLRRTLVEAKLLPPFAIRPSDDPERVSWESEQFKKEDPYSLRRRAPKEKLEPYEIGRAIVHLNQRRGFRSNRKTDRARKKENSEILQEITQLEGKLGDRTLGQYLAGERGEDPQLFHLSRLRGRHTHRDMYEREFDAIWSVQRGFHSSLLTDELREEIYRLIFFQRPIQPPSPSLVGRCELESRLPRCARADRRAQRFRLYQEVNNLAWIDHSTGQEYRFRDPENAELRQKLIRFLAAKRHRSFDEIRKHLFTQYESIRFNLEEGGRTKLLGMPIDAAMAHKSAFGRAWHNLSEGHKDRIVAAVIDDDEERLRYLLRETDLDPSQVEKLLDTIDLEDGYASYSIHAIKKLLPFVEQGLPLTSRDEKTPCALGKAGYPMPWQNAPDQQPYLPAPPEVTNPLVRQALHEVRKVVNSILREHVYKNGHRLTDIHIELAREIRGTARQRERYTTEMRKREEARSEAAQTLREKGIKPTREAINRYLLWEEQDRVCIYSGQPISFTLLYSDRGEIDVDHILPYSRSLDDSMMNKVVCFRSENSQGVNPAAKGKRAPYEWLAEAKPEKYDQMIQRARRLPYPKLKRFYQKTVTLTDFFDRQFVDTTYITTQVQQSVRCLGAQVLCPKGQHTAELRHQWGLDTILSDLEDSPAWRAAADLPTGMKNRLDHRHHAIDAIIVALTTQSRLQQLAAIRRAEGTERTGEILPEPWEGFRADIETTIRQINVSHRVRRKVSGALHEETVYGPTGIPGKLTVRKELSSLTCSMIPDIRDRVVRQRVVERLHKHGIQPGRGQEKIPAEVWKEPLLMNEEKGIAIRKVRLIRREKSILPIRGGTAYVRPGNTHHVALFEWRENGRTKRDAVFVSMLEAMDRIRRHEPLVNRKHPTQPDAKFLMSLSTNEMVLLQHNGKEELYRFDTAASTTGQMWFRHHTAAGKSTDKIGLVSKKPSTFVGRKVTVDPIGRVRWAND